jgi:hypothetical protein
MKAVRFIAAILFQTSRIGAILFLATGIYASAVVLLFRLFHATWLPIEIDSNNAFRIFYPFTRKAFLLGDYTSQFIITNFFTIIFYGFFLLLLSGVFYAFRQQKLFTKGSVTSLTRFYFINLVIPVFFLILLLLFQNDVYDLIRIVCLHLVIGIFAFFMAAIFKQGLLLQEEQDLTF